MKRWQRDRKKLGRHAARAPDWVRHVIATKWSARRQHNYRDRRLGKFGAASEVRFIEPEVSSE